MPNLRRLVYGTLSHPTTPFSIRALPLLTHLDLYRCRTTYGSLLLNFFTSLRILTITLCVFTDIKLPPVSGLTIFQAVNSKLTKPCCFRNYLPKLMSIHICNSSGFQEFIAQPTLRYLSLRNVISNMFIVRSNELETLLLRDVTLTGGNIPRHFGNLPLKTLVISRTNIDVFPESFTNLPLLNRLDIIFDSLQTIQVPLGVFKQSPITKQRLENVKFIELSTH